MRRSRTTCTVIVVAVTALAGCKAKEPTHPSARASRSTAAAVTTPTSAPPTCTDRGSKLKLWSEGVAMQLRIEADVVNTAPRCSPAGIALQLTLTDARGPLPITGNPALVQLGSTSGPGAVFYWSNWCGRPTQHVTITGALDLGRGITARLIPPYTPTCIARSAPSTLTVLLG